MIRVSKGQALATFLVLIVTVLLFIADTKPSKTSLQTEMPINKSVDFRVILEDDLLSLEIDQKNLIEKLKMAFENASGEEKKLVADSLVKKLSLFQKPLSAAYYKEQLALMKATSNDWEEAGNRYMASTRFIEETKKSQVFKKAMYCFEKAVELDKQNINAKINLAACYVEGTSEPMRGISMLKEIEKEYANNINLQLTFAMFSEKSGQFDKVIERYNKVLSIDTTYLEAYLHLADAYENMEDTNSAIESLKQYLNRVDDINIKSEVNNYITKLSQKRLLGKP